MQNRSGAIDALRVLGIVAIVAGHTWDNDLVRAGLYSWHVPLFFFLTGYLWTAKRPLQEDLKKRARALLIPYAVWMLLIGAAFLVWLYAEHKFGAGSVLNLLWGGNHLSRPFSAFWFVTALFIAVALLRLLERLPSWASWAAALAGLAVAYIAGDTLAGLPLSAGVAVPALIFMLAGIAFRQVKPRINAPATSGFILAAAGTTLALSGIAAPFDMKQANFGTPVLSVVMAVMICTGMMLLVEAGLSKAGPQAHITATTLALGGFMVVLTHAVVLWVMGADADGSATVFLTALVGPWVLALGLARTPMAPYLLGVRSTARLLPVTR